MVLLLSIITVLGAVFVSLLSRGFEDASGGTSSARALYIAEAGKEAAIGHLNKSPSAANWIWNDGYKTKAVGGGTVDVEVLQLDYYPNQTSVSPYCVTVTSRLLNTTVNPARTVLAILSWDPAVNAASLGIELYNTDLVGSGTCATPGVSPVATATAASTNPQIIRYRIPEPGSFPSTVTYTVRVLGNTGGAHKLSVSHPDQSGFTTANDTRSVISTGKASNAIREIYMAFRRQPC